MKRNKLSMIVAVLLSSSLLFSSCIGSFALTRKLHSWNESIGNKFVNELVFLAFNIIPVYGVSLIADGLVINSIEFWSGSNPVAENVKHIEGENGNYLVKTHNDGYTITDEKSDKTVELIFDKNEKTWSVEADGQTAKLMTFVDDNHVNMYTGNGQAVTVELSQAGVLAYKNMVDNGFFFANK